MSGREGPGDRWRDGSGVRMSGYRPQVVILGGGFGGLWAAKRLAGQGVDVTLVDRRNHHVFQPLLYQVATASLSPAQIAAPIRKILGRAPNIRVLLGEATGVDVGKRVVTLDGGAGGTIEYDYLIVATGLTHNYFGQDGWAEHAPGLKSIEDALEIRRRFLLAFEAAEREADDAARREALTFVVVGGGPTGVELAGAMSEIARRTVPTEFRRVDTRRARVVLVEGGERLLGTFPPAMSKRALADLQALGVEVRLGVRVTRLDETGVTISPANAVAGGAVAGGAGEAGTGERLAARNVFWAAGVRATAITAQLGAPLDRAGRVLVRPDCSIADHPEVFVIGDVASLTDTRTNRPVPGVAPAAMQMGRHVADLILTEVRGPSGGGGAPGAAQPAREPFT
jgi:NADH dehydrogenase